MFDLGDVVPLEFLVKDPSGTLANATTVTLTITQPDQTVAGPFTLTPTTTGVYDYDFTATQPGRHLARCVATGANACAFTDAFDVADVDPGFVISLADIKDHLTITSTTHDETLRTYLAAATQLIEFEIGAVVVRSVTEVLGALNSITLTNSPVIVVSSILTSQGVDLSSYFVLNGPAGLLSVNPTAIGYPFALRPYVYPGMPLDRLYYQGILPFYPGQPLTISYTAGRSQIPSVVQLAARFAVGEWWKSQRGSMPLPARGGEQEQPEPGYGFTLPDQVLQMLASMPKAPVVG